MERDVERGQPTNKRNILKKYDLISRSFQLSSPVVKRCAESTEVPSIVGRNWFLEQDFLSTDNQGKDLNREKRQPSNGLTSCTMRGTGAGRVTKKRQCHFSAFSTWWRDISTRRARDWEINTGNPFSYKLSAGLVSQTEMKVPKTKSK